MRSDPRTHKCAVADCKKPTRVKHLMCGRHWSMLPKQIQESVSSSWRALAWNWNEENLAIHKAETAKALAFIDEQEAAACAS